jgi:hypothetical protein
MRIFKKQAAASPKQEELAGRIAGSIIRRQIQIAGYLNGKTKHLSGQRKLLWLILFCVVFAAINIYLLINSLTH